MGKPSLKEATKAITNGMREWLPSSFVWRVSEERFVRSFDEKSDYLYVAVWARLGRHIFGITPAVGISSVNDLRRRVLQTETIEPVVTSQLWTLDGKSRPQVIPPLPGSEFEYHWEFETESELAFGLGNCRSLYFEYIEPFFESIQTQKDAHRALNENTIDDSNGRLLNGLLAAVGESEPDWKRVVDRIRNELSDWPESDQQRYEAIISKLDIIRKTRS